MRVRFLIPWETTKIRTPFAPMAPEGWESEVHELVDGGGGFLVDIPFPEGTVRQYVPARVVEVIR